VQQNIGSETAVERTALHELQAICRESFQRFVRTGDGSRIRELNEFLDYTLVRLCAQEFRNRMDFMSYMIG
jgi:hypothetical protein